MEDNRFGREALRVRAMVVIPTAQERGADARRSFARVLVEVGRDNRNGQFGFTHKGILSFIEGLLPSLIILLYQI